MLRFTRFLPGIALVTCLFTTPLVHWAHASAQDSGLTGDASYESPSFGYAVEWSENWAASEEGTIVTDTGDQLVLMSDVYGARIDIDSTDAKGLDAQEFADAYLANMKEARNNVEVVEANEQDAWYGQPAYFVTYTADSDATIDDYFEIQIAGDALILVELRTGQMTGFATVEVAAAEITLNDDSLFAFFGDTTELASYESPTYGTGFSYDPAIWSVTSDLASDENDGRDLIVLESESLEARVFVENYDGYGGDPSVCIDAAASEVVGDVDQAELLLDANGEDFKGSSSGINWAAYAIEASDTGAQLNVYIECQALPAGAGVFVFTLVASEGTFGDAYEAGIAILESITFTSPSDTPNSQTTPEHGEDNNAETGDRSG